MLKKLFLFALLAAALDAVSASHITTHTFCSGAFCDNSECSFSPPRFGYCPSNTTWYCDVGCGSGCDAANACGGGHFCSSYNNNGSNLCATTICTCLCPSGTSDCSGVCVDTYNDNLNCGTCGNQCVGGQFCSGGQCVCPAGQNYCLETGSCTNENLCCASGYEYCVNEGGCVPQGQCLTCGPGEIECNGQCVNTTSNNSNCGTCGTTCGYGRYCNAGVCSCPPGYVDCQGLYGQACVNATYDNYNCGACGVQCTGEQSCQNGTCQCSPGEFYCALQGQCADLVNEQQNCGACGNTCSGQTYCSNGVCTCPSGNELCGTQCVSPGTCCGSGQENCSGTCVPQGTCTCPAGQSYCQGQGCVSTQWDNSNCGSCGNACTNGKTCQAGVCACPAGTSSCSGQCIDTLSDPNNCGTCGTTCGAHRVSPGCSNGQCTTCQSGWLNCDGVASNGCEASTSSNSTCGPLGTACNNNCNANGSCVYPSSCSGNSNQCYGSGYCTCNAPYQNCDALQSNGCEANTQTSNSNCGSCGNSCGSNASCVSGACACNSGYASCFGSCVNLQNNNSNCGSCGVACTGGMTCQSGVCACPSGQSECGGTCVNTQSSNSNCGSCGNVCPVGSTCLSGTCTCPAGSTNCGNACCGTNTTCSGGNCSCSTGWGNCDNNYLDGCENSLSSGSTCGSCTNNCGSNSTCTYPTACSGAQPSQCYGNPVNCSCNAPFKNCVTTSTSCETNTNTSNSHCGSCGNACSGGMTCQAGACACPASAPTNCNGTCTNLQNNSQNCGQCGNACTGGRVCSSGLCVCPSWAPTDCGGTCTATATDPANCGSCGNQCAVGQGCFGGQCLSSETVLCYSCEDCSAKLSAGKSVVISRDSPVLSPNGAPYLSLLNWDFDCIEWTLSAPAPPQTLNCAGAKIASGVTGVPFWRELFGVAGHGIRVNTYSLAPEVTIKDCTVASFDKGILLESVYGNARIFRNELVDNKTGIENYTASAEYYSNSVIGSGGSPVLGFWTTSEVGIGDYAGNASLVNNCSCNNTQDIYTNGVSLIYENVCDDWLVGGQSGYCAGYCPDYAYCTLWPVGEFLDYGPESRSCVDVLDDGYCRAAYGQGYSCCGGECLELGPGEECVNIPEPQCPPGTIRCDGVCTNTQVDPTNCGYGCTSNKAGENCIAKKEACILGNCGVTACTTNANCATLGGFYKCCGAGNTTVKACTNVNNYYSILNCGACGNQCGSGGNAGRPYCCPSGGTYSCSSAPCPPPI